jgi:hypothetical protein
MASESLGPRQKRRKLQKVMNNILLVEEANYSVAKCVNGDSVEHEKEENYIYEDPTGEPVYDDYSLQVIEDQKLNITKHSVNFFMTVISSR